MKSKLFDSIVRACEPEQVDWGNVHSLVASLGPEINDRYEEGTILSELYTDVDAYKQGKKLLEITRIFLSLGYDVHANNGMNGGECLSNLCWSSYDGFILEIAELLLDAGADPNYGYSEGFDKSGTLDDISWKLGSWNTGEYLEANLFEAYYRMIELAQSGEDYHGIRDVSTCVGKHIKKIEKVSLVQGETNKRHKEFFVVWCDEVPLVISETVEIYVDPSIDRFAVGRENLSNQYSDLIGNSVTDFLYMDPTSAQLVLDGGRLLLIIGDEIEGHPFVHLMDDASQPTVFPNDKNILGLYFYTGKRYSIGSRDYEEDTVLIKTDSENYLLYADSEDLTNTQIRVLEIGRIHSRRMDRRLATCDIRFVESFYIDNSLYCLHFLCDGKHLYLTATEYHEIKLVMHELQIDPACIGNYSEPFECMKIRFGDPSGTGFRNLSLGEDRLELFNIEKKRYRAMLDHGSITEDLYNELIQNMVKKIEN